MDTRHTKRSKIKPEASDSSNPGSRWKGSLPNEPLSDFGDEIWQGIVPSKPQRPMSEFEREYNYPFGTTRSEGPTFFKPASLRQEEPFKVDVKPKGVVISFNK